MDKFTLNEAFDKVFELALQEKINDDIDDLCEMFNREQNDFLDTLTILQEATLLELTTGGSGGIGNGNDGGKEKDEPKGNFANPKKEKDETEALEKSLDANHLNTINNIYGQAMAQYEKMSKAISDKAMEKRIADQDMTYKPLAGFTEVTKMSEMKFPANIIFFITQFIKWIKNNVLNFIDKFSNIVRALLGLETGKGKFSKEDLKLKFEKAKAIETKYVIGDNDVYRKDKSFNNYLSGDEVYTSEVKPVSLLNLPYSEVKQLGLLESLEDINIFKNAELLTEGSFNRADIEKSAGGDSINVIKLDTTKDLFALKQSLDHFFDLFDNSYGSNDEKLFSIDDLEIMLKMFTNTLELLKNGANMDSALEIRGELTFSGDAINATRLKDNLLRTKINTDNLKAAYVVTNKQINQIAQIIMNKNLLGASQMGVQYAFLSASTYETMINILKIIDERLKDAKEMEKKLNKMKTAYVKLTNALDAKRAKLNTLSGLAYTTIIQRKVNELYDGARYMTQTVQLRLNTLALYISELNDTRAILKNLNAIPEASLGKAGIKRMKQLFA